MQRTFTLKAGSSQTFSIEGRFFVALSSTASFEIQPDRRDRKSMSAGRPAFLQDFKTLTFHETSNSDNVITFDAGNDQISIPPEQVAQQTIYTENKETYPKASGIADIAPAGEESYSGLDGANKRKKIVVSNREIPTGILADDYAKVLEVADGDDNEGVPVYPGGSIVLETGGTVKVLNNSGAAISRSVMEIFYGTP